MVDDPVKTLRQDNLELAQEWRRLGRLATILALCSSPLFFAALFFVAGWSVHGAILGTILAVAASRGLTDVLASRFLPSASLFGLEGELAEEDIVEKRRLWFWRRIYRLLVGFAILAGTVFLVAYLFFDKTPADLISQLSDVSGLISSLGPQLLQLMFIFFIFFIGNMVIFIGPLIFMGIQQIKGYEPGDADWGVKLSDIRGQDEAKEEITRVVALWQSGDQFELSGGKRERGVLFLGPPGTGKTMLAKGIATSFNCPFISIPGSGFASTFIGVDAIIVRYLAFKAKRLARKWGGQCIIFIDEIDAVGMRRLSLGSGFEEKSFTDLCFYGPWGSLTPSGDLVLESRPWRDRLFRQRNPDPSSYLPASLVSLAGGINRFIFPGGGGGGLALNQLLVVMDGIGGPPWFRKTSVRLINSLLDDLYIIPQKIGKLPLRLKRPKSREEQLYFIGACNTPLESLDPALTRPGRMGRHAWFRTPTKDDRIDIFDLYLSKVDHDRDLDREERRDELARITSGYSPAMIEQVCSMALTIAYADDRAYFNWQDIGEAMTTIEAGTAVGVEYAPSETRAVAIHEAGHAVASHLYMKDTLSTRLSIRKRGSSLGHHQAVAQEERFSSWKEDEFAQLIWTLGAMAAEETFYSQTSTGVGGDLFSATSRAAWMVGSCGMGPETLSGGTASREKTEERLEAIGLKLMNRSGGPISNETINAVLSDSSKRRSVAILLGQAYLIAWRTIQVNKEAVESIADVLIEEKEISGDAVVELLDSAGLKKPKSGYLSLKGDWPEI